MTKEIKKNPASLGHKANWTVQSNRTDCSLNSVQTRPLILETNKSTYETDHLVHLRLNRCHIKIEKHTRLISLTRSTHQKEHRER
jgi:hypothetical protein